MKAIVSNWKALSGYVLAALFCAALLVPYESFGAITIPNTIDVDALGTSTMATAAPVLVSIIGFSIVAMLVGLGIRIVFRKVRRIGNAG